MLTLYASKWRYGRHGKLDEICQLAFVLDEFSGLSLHHSVFSIIDSRSSYIINDTIMIFDFD